MEKLEWGLKIFEFIKKEEKVGWANKKRNVWYNIKILYFWDKILGERNKNIIQRFCDSSLSSFRFNWYPELEINKQDKEQEEETIRMLE